MQIVIALIMIALGMCIDVMYQHKIRVAECDAYETGYQQGLRENTIRREITVPELPAAREAPSMAAPVEMPPTAVERLRKHGRATWRVER